MEQYDESIAKKVPRKLRRCITAESEIVNAACQRHKNNTDHFTADALAEDDGMITWVTDGSWSSPFSSDDNSDSEHNSS